MRHNLAHGYYKVDPDIVWAIIHNDLKPLREQVTGYIADIDWNEWEKSELVIKESAVHKSLIQTASRIRQRGYDTNEISKITGLSKEEIDTL